MLLTFVSLIVELEVVWRSTERYPVFRQVIHKDTQESKLFEAVVLLLKRSLMIDVN